MSPGLFCVHRSFIRLQLCFALASAALSSLVAQETASGSRDVHRDPTLPSWVVPHHVETDAPGPDSASASDVYYLLADRQVHAEEESRFSHYAYRLMSESGVQDNAQLTFDFDPEHETLTLHKLFVIRAGQAIDRLADQKVQVLQRETGAERQLYDGSLSAVLLLEDVRVGDVIEYAYTITGANPVFGGHFSDFEMVRWGSPLHQSFLRVLWSQDRPVTMRTQDTPVAPTLTRQENLTVATLEEKRLPAILEDDSVPGSFPTRPWVEFSDYRTWTDVARWAAAQYPQDEPLPPMLEAVVARLKTLPDDETRVLSALRWVQDEIRYVGLFDGIHSHRPHPLDMVCQKRFGDCKDKSTLLVRLLRAVGIDARHALVATSSRKAIIDWLPSPDAFDHVVVRVVLNGRIHWLDGTRTYQRGLLKDLYFPDYGFALVVADDTTDLTPVQPSGFEANRMEVLETLNVKDYASAAEFRVVSTYHGGQAESMRAHFASTSRDSIEKDYLNHYSRDFPGIRTLQPLTADDDELLNRFTTVETYEIDELWTVSDENESEIEMEVYARIVAGELRKPSTRIRTMPFAVSHPREVTHRLILTFPTPLNLVSDRTQVKNPAFEFGLEEIAAPQRLELIYRYRSLRDEVEAAAMPAYLKAIAAAENVLVYGITVPKRYQAMTPDAIRAEIASAEEGGADDQPYRPVWTHYLLSALVFLLAAGVCIPLYFWNPAPRRLPERWRSDLTGLGGWLLFIGFNVIITPVARLILGLVEVSDWNAEVWTSVTQPSSASYDPLWEPATLVNLASLWALLPLDVLLLILYFRKRTSFPLLMISRFILDLLASVLVAGLFIGIQELDAEVKKDVLKDAAQSTFGLLVWVPYLLVSKRVRLTFYHRRGPQAPPPLPTQPPPPMPPTLPA